MSAQDKLGLRQYRRTDNRSSNSTVKSSVRNHRPSTQIKDMLVAKFLSRVSIGIKDPAVSQAKDAELKLQANVSKEFEKFLASGQFTQKNLEIFEKDLKVRLKDFCERELNVTIKNVNNAASHRVLASQGATNHHYGLDQNNKTDVSQNNYGVKLPAISGQGRYSIDITDKSQFLKHSIHKKTSSTKQSNYASTRPPMMVHQKSMTAAQLKQPIAFSKQNIRANYQSGNRTKGMTPSTLVKRGST